jgi:hypothetical protein
MPKRHARKAADSGATLPPDERPDLDHLRREDRADAFIKDPGDGPALTDDDLAQTLAQEYLRSATSGEDTTEDAFDEVVPEEIGGPFVETSASEEFAGGTDASNPADAEREPLPQAVGGLMLSPDEDEESK